MDTTNDTARGPSFLTKKGFFEKGALT